MEEIKLVTVSPSNPDLTSLISRLDDYLFEKYSAEEVFVVDFNDAKVEKILFVVAYSNEMPVGCGAIKPIDDTYTELKRFYVEPLHRRNGIAKQMLDYLELKAKDLKHTVIRLETGDQQPEAISFYKKHGYCEIERFGDYTDCESSVCYEKQL